MKTDALKKELARVESLLSERGLRRSRPRELIVETFMAVADHVTAEELTSLARRRDARIGLATVYRTLRLLVDCGLCRELRLEDGTARFEPLRGSAHHDHLICVRCHKLVEAVDAEIERLQERLCRRHGFTAQHHRMEIYGLCDACRAAGGSGGSGQGGKAPS